MKKLFIVLLSVVALLAFTVSAYALHGTEEMLDYTPSVVKAKNAQIEFFGHTRIRGSLKDNTSDFKDTDESTGATDDDDASYDHRVRLGLRATVSPNSQFTLELENASENQTTGVLNPSSDNNAWGAVQGGGGVYNRAGNAKASSLTIRQAYAMHQGTDFGMLTGWKAGHMLIALGNGAYYNHTQGGDDAIILFAQPMDNTEIAFAIIKGDENSAGGNNAADVDIYAITAETAMNGMNLSGDISLLRDNTMNAGEGINLWNLGLRGGTKVAGAKVDAGCNIQTGEIEKFKAAGGDMDLSGWQCEIKAGTKIGNIDVHGGISYGSGDDIDSADDYEGFITSLSPGGDTGTFVYDNSTKTAAQKTFSAAATSSSSYGAGSGTNGSANTWYLNVGATANVTPDISVNGEVFYLQASENVSNVTDLNDKDIGFEVDGKVTYQVDTALAYYIEAGMLFAGDFYKNVTGAGVSPDDVWRVRHGIVLSF